MIGSQSMRGGGGDRVSGIELACKRLIRQMFSRAAAEVTPQRYPHDRLAAVIPVDTARYAVQKTQASHRLCRGPAHERVNLADTAAGNRPYAHAFRCPAQRCYGAAAFTNTSLVPADRAGSRNARRNRPVAGECRVIGPVPNTGRTSPEIIVRPREGTKDRMALTVHIAIHTGITAM